ncbi:MAG TPA: carboxylesterase family protein [Burkholderiaceae bacterium]|jgi:para-nitrobenzyl esterase|nr:carboxylesterase family protein [Burkholderiaceae bacterium]
MMWRANDGAASTRARTLTAQTLSLALLLTAGALANPAVAAEVQDGPVVSTSNGPVRGFVKDGVYQFLGVPYAAPPVGPLRWMPPRPPASWDAPRDATQFGNTCAQVTELGVFAGPPNTNEDCLYLNVFTTQLGRGSGGGHAVLVWIHGGGNVDGESNDYDGSKLATGGPLGTPTVVVTINYRLNLFGFLAHPALDSEGHLFANYGILDQQAALRWVQRNIAAFGGDPSRVALGGQSAGAQDTGINQISPLSTGLFNRAIYESSPLSSLAPLSLGLTRGMAFAAAAGCPGTDAATAACLRALPAAQILQLVGTPNVTGPYVTGPMVDGTLMPVTPITAWTTNRFNHMPIMGGNVQDEANFGIGITQYFANPQAPITAAQYVASVTGTYSGPEYPAGPNYPAGTVDKVLAQYPAGENPQATFDLVGTHPGACRNRHIDALWTQAGVPVYEYEFNDQSAPYYFPILPGFTPLAAHTIDIQFLFPDWHGGVLGFNHPATLTAEEEKLSDELVAAWTNFAATGNPNGTGNSPWPRYTTSDDQPAFLSENVPTLSTFTNSQWSDRHNCAFWDSIIVYQP